MVRQQVGPLSLEIDPTLRPPTAYQFVSHDGSVSLELEVNPVDTPRSFAASPPTEPAGLYETVGLAAGDLGGPSRFEIGPDPWAEVDKVSPRAPAFATEAVQATSSPEESREKTVGAFTVRVKARSKPEVSERRRSDLDALDRSLRPSG